MKTDAHCTEYLYQLMVAVALPFCFWPLIVAWTNFSLRTDDDFDSGIFEIISHKDVSFQASGIALFIVTIPSTLNSVAVILFDHISHRVMKRQRQTRLNGITTLRPSDRFVFLMGSSLVCAVNFFPRHWSSPTIYVAYTCSTNASTVLMAYPILSYLTRATKTWSSILTASILLCNCLGSILNSASFAMDGAIASLYITVGNVFILSALGLFTVGCCTSLLSFMKEQQCSPMKAVKLFFNVLIESALGDNNAESNVSMMEAMQKSTIPALHMITGLILYGLNAVWYWNTKVYTIKTLAIYQWVNFGAVVLFLLIEVHIKNNELECTMMQLLAVKKSYVRYISHELRTPLNAVAMGIKLLAEDLKSNTNPENVERLELLTCMEGGCEAAVDLLNDILSFDKVDSGTIELKKNDINTTKFLSETVKLFRPTATMKNVNIRLVICESDGQDVLNWDADALPIGTKDSIEIDIFRMRQIFRNVLANALKYTPNGGEIIVKAWISESGPSEQGDIPSSSVNFIPSGKSRCCRYFSPSTPGATVADLETGQGLPLKPRSFLKVAVIDSGPGIDPADQKRIFSEVFSFKPEQLQGVGGSGLGLHVSKLVAQSHGGDISMSSGGAGMGCALTIDIPLNRRRPSIAFSSSMSESISDMSKVGRSFSFLVVDDSTVSRKVLCKFIRSLGHDCIVHESENGKDAIEKVRLMALNESINGYDAVFMDSVMPVMDGPTAVKEIRALGFKNHIFGVTGNALESQISDFMQCGVDRVFTKPLDTKAFARAIESLPARTNKPPELNSRSRTFGEDSWAVKTFSYSNTAVHSHGSSVQLDVIESLN